MIYIYIQRRIAILNGEERDPVNTLLRKLISRHEINTINIGNEPKPKNHVNDLVLLDRFDLITIIPSSSTEPPATSP